MGRNIFYEKLGKKRTIWCIMIVLGITAFCLIFSGAYTGFFGRFLTWEYKGLIGIPAKILGFLIIMIMISVWNT